MKYFIVADVHGFYDELMTALDKSGFDKNNPNHTFVSLGDLLDRGLQPNECLKFVNELERKILIRGNHEDLIEEMFKYGFPQQHDISNGTFTTAINLVNKSQEDFNRWFIRNTLEQKDVNDEAMEIICKAQRKRNLKTYLKSTIDYFETEHYVFVHGWIPCFYNRIERNYLYFENWRNDATKFDWNEARWTSGYDASQAKIFEPNKTILCGHIHASRWHERLEGKGQFADNSPYITKDYVALDTCTVISKKVNVYVIED